MTRSGAFVRSGHLQHLTAAGRAALLDHGVRVIVDLRERDLVDREPCPLAGDALVDYARIPLVPPGFPLPVPADQYHRILDSGSAAIQDIFHALAAAPRRGGVLFHCHSGTGRTGLLAMVLLSLADVEQGAVEQDYLLSFSPTEGAPLPASPVASVMGTLRGKYAGVRSYLASIGVTPAEQDAVRLRLTG